LSVWGYQVLYELIGTGVTALRPQRGKRGFRGGRPPKTEGERKSLPNTLAKAARNVVMGWGGYREVLQASRRVERKEGNRYLKSVGKGIGSGQNKESKRENQTLRAALGGCSRLVSRIEDSPYAWGKKVTLQEKRQKESGGGRIGRKEGEREVGGVSGY